MHVSICLMTWNDARYLPELFASLRAQTFQDVSVRIFDNGSADGETIPYLLREEPHWLAARSAKHVGSAAAKNQLIRLACERYRGNPDEHFILLAESDTVWHQEMLMQMVEKLKSDPSLDAVQPKILRAFSERGDFDADTVHSDILDSTGGEFESRWRLADRGAGTMDREQFDLDPRPILPMNGVLLVRASALADIMIDGKVFDESFLAANEDIDFALRFARAGHTTGYLPAARAHRYRGTATTPQVSWRLRRSNAPRSHAVQHALRNQWILALKHASIGSLLLSFPVWLMWDAPRACIAALRERETRAALVDFFFSLSALRHARTKVQEQSRCSVNALRQAFRARS